MPPSLSHHIDDSLRHDDDPLRFFSLKRPLNGGERQHRCFDIATGGIAGDRDIGALAAIDLHWEGHGVLDKQGRLDLRPGRLRHQAFMTEHRKALLRQMRHHRVEERHQDVRGLTDRPT